MHLKSLTLKGFKSFASARLCGSSRASRVSWDPTAPQVERRRRPHLGDGGAGREGASRRKDAGRHLRRHRRAGPARPRRGDAHDRQLRRRSAHRVLRGVHHTTDVPRRRRRVRDQRQLVPPDGRAGTAQRLRYRPGDARHRRAGSAVRDPRIASEDRRAFIEEAAGVLKHRKRKEKAVRKLDAMQANLARLTDLTAELRRQLKPLGRQAEVARRAQTVQADLRDARLRLAADDLVTRRPNSPTRLTTRNSPANSRRRCRRRSRRRRPNSVVTSRRWPA